MKQILLSLFILTVLVATGCEDETQFDQDRQALEQYLADNNIEAEYNPQGFYYRIITPGAEAKPNRGSRIEIRYRGELLDGTVFDQSPGNQTIEFPLAGLITGWQLGIPLIGRGGEIELFLPSQYGYGRVGSPPTIPPNAPLYFYVELVNFEN